MNKNKLTALGLSAIMALSLAACGNANANTPNVQPPNPFTDHQTLAEAEEQVGFEFTVPDAIKGFDECVYRADKEGGMVEVIFQNGDEEICFRKAIGDGDISGDYNEYAQAESVDGVTLKGENDAFSLAIWEKDGYAYSISVGEALAQSDMMALVAAVQ